MDVLAAYVEWMDCTPNFFRACAYGRKGSRSLATNKCPMSVSKSNSWLKLLSDGARSGTHQSLYHGLSRNVGQVAGGNRQERLLRH